MASTPQQTPRWRRQSIQPDLVSSQETSSSTPPTTSNAPPRSLNAPQPAEAASSSQTNITRPTLPSSNKEVRTCWICQQDETEDTPEDNIWRTPCPCSLKAHDSCLLEWIANEEAPKPGEMAQKRKILCPQCKAEIKIQRPRDYLVSVVDNIQWLSKRLMIPAALGATVGVAYSGFLVYGMNAMTLVFGADETRNMLLTGLEIGTEATAQRRHTIATALHVMFPFIPASEEANPAVLFTVPLIAPALVILRTSWADLAFPVLLPLYFLKPTHQNPLTWPPSPGLTLATLPFLRALYKGLYNHTFSPLEKKWDLAVQRKPREGETAEQIAAAAAAEVEHEHAIFELEWVEEEVNVPDEDEIGAEIREEGDVHGPVPAGGEGFDLHGAENEGLAPEPNAPQPNPPQINANAHNHNHNHIAQHDISILPIATTVLGALFFPAISSFMGTILKHTIPTSTLNKSLLREKWGRSIVGGCLFVVLKDAVVLYCKWKKARDFGKRRVLDFVGGRGR